MAGSPASPHSASPHSPSPAEVVSGLEASGWPGLVAGGCVALGLGLGVATQLVAYRLGPLPELGRPWLWPALGPPWGPVVYLAGAVAAWALAWGLLRARLGRALAGPLVLIGATSAALAAGPLYPPWAALRWLPVLLGEEVTRSVGLEAAACGLATTLASGVVALLVLGVRQGDVSKIAHGSARLATRADLEAAGLLGGRGVRLGAWRQGRTVMALTDASDQHVLLVMPSGAGKTTGHIVPTLLSSTTPAVVLDPKGELWETTSGWRQAQGHECLFFNPTDSASEVRWNPLAEISPGEGMLQDLRVMAESLISSPAGEGQADHWIQSARRLCRVLALHALLAHDGPSMAGIRALLADPDRPIRELLEDLQDFEHDPARPYRSAVTGEPSATHPEVALGAAAFAGTPDKEFGSIVSTLHRYLDLWAEPAVGANTSRSTFSVRDLLDPREPRTLYIGLPYGDLSTLGPLLRILLGMLIRRLTTRELPSPQKAEGGRLLFLLDEFASLGRLPILEDMLAFFRGYGARGVLVVQDLNQLTRIFGRHETLSAACQIHVIAATQSVRTRQVASSLVGEATVRYRRRSRSAGRWLGGRTTWTETDVKRPLLTPGEVGALPQDRLLILKSGMAPALAWKSPFYREPALLEASRWPPASDPERTRPREAP